MKKTEMLDSAVYKPNFSLDQGSPKLKLIRSFQDSNKKIIQSKLVNSPAKTDPFP